MLRSWSGADDVSLLCCRLQGLQAWLRLKEEEKILAKTRFRICDGRGCRLKILSGGAWATCEQLAVCSRLHCQCQ